MSGPLITPASAWLLALIVGGLGAGAEALAGGSTLVGVVLPLACLALAVYLHRAPGQREKLERLPGGSWVLVAVVVLVLAGLVARWATGQPTVAALLSAVALGGVIVPLVLTTRSGAVGGSSPEDPRDRG
ncbi:hypothetical protein [Nesterenkonia sp. F]|uniref:hypothetical protein n=1 Tax=Nesterenkonia sp. F TaxID=795955 RepID=UPI000255C99C|nr:hypothetical protein [Nesterenkonia sp. F]